MCTVIYVNASLTPLQVACLGATCLGLAIWRLKYKKSHWVFWVILGALWAWVQVNAKLNQNPMILPKGTYKIQAEVLDFPKQAPSYTRLKLKIVSVDPSTKKRMVLENALLTGRQKRLLTLSPQDTLEACVRMMPVHFLSNPGSTEPERHYFVEGIRYKGKIMAIYQIQRRRFGIQPLRGVLYHQMKQHLGEHPLFGILTALTLGVKHAISDAQWKVLQRTGTTHLMAISGLHIGLFAAGVGGVVGGIWRWIPRWHLVIALPRVQALAGLCGALGYSALAGFSLPTLRACWMMAWLCLSIWMVQRIRPWVIFALALWGVLIFDPLCVLEFGFWLSFSAVFWLMYGLWGRGHLHWIKKMGWTQWVVFWGAMPLSLAFFGQMSLVAPLINMLAILWVGFWVVPFALAGLVFLGGLPSFGLGLLKCALWGFKPLWGLLQWVSDGAGVSVDWPVYAYSGVFWAILGGFIWLAPKGVPGRWVGLAFWVPLIWPKTQGPKMNEAWITVLDVGQGLSVLVQSQNHQLLYDTGPRYYGNWDAAKRVILPALTSYRIDHLDALIISHPDLDHSGGYNSLSAHMPIEILYTSAPESFSNQRIIKACHAGQSWEWDGVHFEFLFPFEPSSAGKNKNNQSCVLKVTANGQSILLTGDIQKAVEKKLQTHLTHKLASTVMLVPHHGSAYSSSESFIQAVHPKVALISVGHRNRYHHPSPLVIQRYENEDIQLYRTDQMGALSLKIGKGHRELFIEQSRNKQHNVWSSFFFDRW